MMKHYKRRKKSKLNFSNILGLLSVVLFMVAFVFAFKGISEAKDNIDKNTINPSSILESENTNEKIQEEIESSLVDIDLNSFFKSPIEKNNKVSNEYFDNVVFLGDVITEGLKLYGPENAFIASYADASLSTISEKRYEKYNDKTLLETVSKADAQYIYILFGANDLNNGNKEDFIINYEKLINYLKISNPNSIIYIQSIMPVTKEYSHNSDKYNNEIIKEINGELLKIADKHKIIFLDSNRALINEEGNLDSAASPNDGLLFNEESFKKWLDYIVTHTLPLAYEIDILEIQNTIIE